MCPVSVLSNWAREAHRFAPSIPVLRYHGADRSLDGLKPNAIVLTTYGVADLVPAENGVPIRDKKDAVLARLTPASARELEVEGSGRLPDGRVLNVFDEDGHYRFLPQGVLATGTGGRHLTPWRSVAADQGTQGGKKPWKDDVTRGGPLLPVGTVLYIPDLVGMRLPDGALHDGLVIVEDTGGAIYGAHLDLFVGRKADRRLVTIPSRVSVAFEGSEEIPEDYTYGLEPAPGRAYKGLRPPRPARRVA